MTTTDIATIEPETEAPQLLTKREAKALDKKIRTASDKLSTTSENLLDLLEQAAAGQIHEALELPSWTAWFKDAVQINVSNVEHRKELAKLMAGKGMSQRAIAGSLGVSQMTVSRDVEGEELPDTVTSLDGAERPRNGKAAAAEEDYIEGEVVGEEDEAAEPMKAVDIVTTFGDEMANLVGAQSELTYLVGEDKWANSRKRIVARDLNNLQECITALQSIVDDLMEP